MHLMHYFIQYRVDEEEDFNDDDNGWKIIHTDVFRFPKVKSLFCSVIGVGCQLLAIGTGKDLSYSNLIYFCHALLMPSGGEVG